MIFHFEFFDADGMATEAHWASSNNTFYTHQTFEFISHANDDDPLFVGRWARQVGTDGVFPDQKPIEVIDIYGVSIEVLWGNGPGDGMFK